MKKIVVIGAGISGLSAAIYAARSGFDVTLCEQHSIAGGMCTSWKRKGYLFEGAVHWLTGSNPKTQIYQLWRETGALNEQVPVILHERFYAAEWEGKTISIYRNIEKTAKHFLEISPDDKKQIIRLVKDVKAFSKFEMPVTDIKGVKAQNPKPMKFGTLLKMIPAFPRLIKLNRITCKDYTDKFTHIGIQKAFKGVVPDEYSAVALIVTLSTLNTEDGGYPEGGSLPMVERMVKTFKDLNGTLLLNTKVKKIKIEDKTVVGVTLDNETELNADAVIVTQETMAALNNLFDTPLPDKWLTDLRKNTKPAVCTFIGIGIRCVLPKPIIPAWELDESIEHARIAETQLCFYNNSGHKGYAPENSSVLTTAFMGDTYDFWKKAKDEGRYEKEKQVLADKICRAVCKKFPQAQNKIEVIDIATPLTYERYTGAYHGSWMSVLGVGDKMTAYPGFSRSISGLYFAGHRMMPPGGLPAAVYTGRVAAQMVCRQFNVLFR
jgi:phytoene dehydrogenase-like protein